MVLFFPLKKLRRYAKYVLSVTLIIGFSIVYLGSNENPENDNLRFSPLNEVEIPQKHVHKKEVRKDKKGVQQDTRWRKTYRLQLWKSEYMGRANLHIFEDWCGSSTNELRKNPHYPLYPHSRHTAKKLAVSPRWTNYGLRIFGYLHPHTSGEYLFAVASDDNSEFWLSRDSSPLNLHLLAYVGKTGKEWTAPGEFGKFGSQVSFPVRLSANRLYFFEVIHKQNGRGTDHVEVVWRLNQASTPFEIIGSKHISLYTDETDLKMNQVGHIPQSPASHVQPRKPIAATSHNAEMLIDDPRDSFYRVPLINELYLHDILPVCTYQPSYTIKGFPLLRYQGLKFVQLSSVYPNDYTRLTHMENDNTCYYRENPYYLERFGFYKYMKMDNAEKGGVEEVENDWNKQGNKWDEGGRDDNGLYRYDELQLERNGALPGNGNYEDSYSFSKKRRLQSDVQAAEPKPVGLRVKGVTGSPQQLQFMVVPTHNISQFAQLQKARRIRKKNLKRQKGDSKQLISASRVQMKNRSASVTVKNRRPKPHVQEPGVKSSQSNIQKGAGQQKVFDKHLSNVSKIYSNGTSHKLPIQKPLSKADTMTYNRVNTGNEGLRELEMDMDPAVYHQEYPADQNTDKGLKQIANRKVPTYKLLDNMEWNLEGKLYATKDSDDYEMINPAILDPVVNWGQTFNVSLMDLNMLRSDAIDLRCNVSGNLLMSSREVLPIVQAFIQRLNQKNQRLFSLVQVVNVERRVDGLHGGRYLLELEVQEQGGTRSRVSRYVYVPNARARGLGNRQNVLLCHPLGLEWKPSATVHFVVPVKNQARWVQQFIMDMEELYKVTGDRNFNIIIADYSSTDMDVELALKTSDVPSYQYVRLTGNFERSAGLQAGINLIKDDHSIVFLCDLHIYFPDSIIDNIRKHCVEGKMAFAPIVLRLNCGATPEEPNGFWEVNGFGLLGIYKSDLNMVGGMNTKEFRERWGGEDWELLDRILQAGLEVERIYLRNFMHFYHSKRGMWNRQL